MNKQKDPVAAIRKHLGIVRSCALMMAHAQAPHVRERYLKTLAENIKKMDSLLKGLGTADARAARASD